MDTAGNLYVVHNFYFYREERVLKLAPGSTIPIVLPFSGEPLNSPECVAVDGVGDVYVVERLGDKVVKLPAAASSQTVLPLTGLKEPHDVAADRAGNVYVTDTGDNRVLKLPPD